MNAEIKVGTKSYFINFKKFTDLSIPLKFNGEQPNTYNVNQASSFAYKDNSFVGDTRLGGPCNFETYTLTPHCNGTHTECIGHITDERVSINDSLRDMFMPATLITLTPSVTNETYSPCLNSGDLVVTKKEIESKLSSVDTSFLDGLIIRTVPNNENKLKKKYSGNESPFFTIEAMNYIVELGVKHLLVDFPSVDRLLDEGKLTCHNIFWETDNKKLNLAARGKTITEMIFVSNDIIDGKYLLNIQTPSFVSDAAPSKPIIFEVNEV